MLTPLSASDRDAISALVSSLETAWNNGDGVAFSAPFAADADFVNVRAELHQGRAAIEAGHVGILQSIYANSVNRYTLVGARLIRDDLALVHVKAELDVPAGPLAGHHGALFSMLLEREGNSWQVLAFHNTMEPPRR